MEKEKTPINLTSPLEKIAPLMVINTMVSFNTEDKYVILSLHSGSPSGLPDGSIQAILAGTYALPLSQIKLLKNSLEEFLKKIGEES